MNSFDKYSRYLLRERSMLSRGASPKRFLQFVRHVGADENTLSICHIFMSISRGKIAWAPSAVGSARKPNFVSAVQAVAIIHLGRPLPNGSSGLPENDVGLHRTRNRTDSFRFPIWPCTARSLPGRMCYHTRR